MEYRLGKCSSCGAEYKVPASFAHDVARCKVCKGTVRLGPARAPAPGASAPATSAPVAAASPSAPADRPAPRPAPGPKPEPRSPSRAADVPPAGTPRETPAPRPAPRREEAPPKPAERPRRVASPAKKPLPRGALIALVALIAIGAGAYFVFSGGKEESTTPPAAEPGSAAVPTPAAEVDDGDAAPAPQAPTDDTGEAAPPEAAAAEPPSAPADSAAGAPAPLLDLTSLPDFGPAPESTPESWEELQQAAGTFFDLSAGAAGMRAGRTLEETGRPAVPAILNQMKRIDLSTPEGMRQGDMAQKALERIARGRNYGWKYEGTEGAVDYDRRVIEKWISTWKQCSDDVEAWIRFTNLAEKDPEEAARLRSELGSPAAEPAPDDDLDVD
jgi:hypothetical protein